MRRDKTIYISMPRIPDGMRRPEADLMKQFEQLHPRILGALLDTTVLGLQIRILSSWKIA